MCSQSAFPINIQKSIRLHWSISDASSLIPGKNLLQNHPYRYLCVYQSLHDFSMFVDE